MNHWEEYWKYKKEIPIVENKIPLLYGGTYIEPLASIGMSCFLEPIRDKFKNNFCILDYGCGAGILANFISERLKNFNYYGLEIDSDHGKNRLDIAKTYFSDPRVNFGLINKNCESFLKIKYDAVVLISIFTHLPPEEIENILLKLKSVFDVNPDCEIIFSSFSGNDVLLKNERKDIYQNFYDYTIIPPSLYENFCKINGLKLIHCINFVSQDEMIHNIFKIVKEKNDRVE